MNFDRWMKKKNPKYRTTDDSVMTIELREAYEAGAENERTACAKIVEDAAPGFCGGKAEIVLYTIADSIRDRGPNASAKGPGGSLPGPA